MDAVAPGSMSYYERKVIICGFGTTIVANCPRGPCSFSKPTVCPSSSERNPSVKDHGVVNEYVVATIILDKPVSVGIAEPAYGSGQHRTPPLRALARGALRTTPSNCVI
jgi:hypothetical protein